jgi:hypothetical protein
VSNLITQGLGNPQTLPLLGLGGSSSSSTLSYKRIKSKDTISKYIDTDKFSSEFQKLINTYFIWAGLSSIKSKKQLLIKIYIENTNSKDKEARHSVGNISITSGYCYIPANYDINKFDTIHLLELNKKTGIPTQPFTILNTFIISNVHLVKASNKLPKYYKCFIEKRLKPLILI